MRRISGLSVPGAVLVARDAGTFDILAAVCSLQCEGDGIALFDWARELNEGFAYIDSDKSGTVNGPVEMGKLLYYAGMVKRVAPLCPTR